VFKGLDRMEVEVAGRTAELGLALAALALLAAAAAPVWATGLAFAAGAAAGLGIVARWLRSLPEGPPPAFDRRHLAREGAVFLGLNLSLQARLRLETFMLAAFAVPKERLGLYGVAAAPVWGLLGAAQLLAVAAYPTLAKAAAAGALRAGRVVAIAAAGAAIGAALAAALAAVRVPLVRLVFGPQYLGAAPLLARLAWLLPGACLLMLAGVVVAACGRQAWGLAAQVLVLLAAAAGNAVAIPRWELAGCAGVAVAVWSVAAVLGLGLALAAARSPRLAAAAGSPSAEAE